jgi:hypothetical protein
VEAAVELTAACELLMPHVLPHLLFLVECGGLRRARNFSFCCAAWLCYAAQQKLYVIKRSWPELSSTRTTVGVEDVAVELPLATLLLPDHDVLALIEHLLARAQECVPAHLDRGVTVILDLGNL